MRENLEKLKKAIKFRFSFQLRNFFPFNFCFLAFETETVKIQLCFRLSAGFLALFVSPINSHIIEKQTCFPYLRTEYNQVYKNYVEKKFFFVVTQVFLSFSSFYFGYAIESVNCRITENTGSLDRYWYAYILCTDIHSDDCFSLHQVFWSSYFEHIVNTCVKYLEKGE